MRKIRTVSIIGPGVVGTTMGSILQSKDYQIKEVVYRSRGSLFRAKKYLQTSFKQHPTKRFFESELILISTKDGEILEAGGSLISGIKEGTYVFHVSGASSIKLLSSAKERGACIGSIHPIQTCPNIASA